MCVQQKSIWVPKGPKYEKQKVACGLCWACLQNKVDDVVGRCLLEASASDWTLALTLTYDDKLVESPLQTQTIVKSDLQQFFYRMRKKRKRAGGVFSYNIRYLAAGEYGSQKGRTHFHCILFGQGPRPPIAIKKQYQYLEEWPWGYTYADDVIDHKTLRYVAKYMVKQKAELSGKKRNHHAQEWVTYSKVPLLGAPGVRRLAETQANAQIMPVNLRYNPPGARPKSQYNLFGVAEYIYFDELLSLWPKALTLPANDWITNARLRYIKTRASKAWSYLQKNNALHVTDYFIDLGTNPKNRQFATTELTQDELVWQDRTNEAEWLHSQEDRRQWLDAQTDVRAAVARQMQRQREEWRHDASTR